MEIKQLEYFLISAEKGSLSRAAEDLYTTQPHVSQVIKGLESELGVKLFRRTGTGIALTGEGERILFFARNALKNVELIREECAETETDKLRIAANPSSRLAFLAGEHFQKSMDSRASFQYTECPIEEMMTLLQTRHYDLGFLFLPVSKLPPFRHMAERRKLAYTQLCIRDLVLYAGPQSRFFGRTSVRPEELDGCPLIQLEDDFFSVEDLLMEHEAFRKKEIVLRKAVRTNSDHLMMRMLRETDLCNIGSYWSRQDALRPDLSMAVIEGFQERVSFGCLRDAALPLRAPAAEFLRRMERLLS